MIQWVKGHVRPGPSAPVLQGEEGDAARALALRLHDNAVAQVAHDRARQEGVQRLAQARGRRVGVRRHLIRRMSYYSNIPCTGRGRKVYSDSPRRADAGSVCTLPPDQEP